MASTGTIKVSVFGGNQKPWRGPAVRLVLNDPFAGSSNKKVAEHTAKKGTEIIELKGVPTDAGQRYILFVEAEKHRKHAVFPVKPVPDDVTAINIMLIPNDPVPDFAEFTYKELKLKSPQFHSALSEGVAEGDFLGLPKVDKKFGLVRMAALLNIEAKLRATALKKGAAVDYVRLIKNLDACERDRVKVQVADDMPGNVRGLKSFGELNEELNELNHRGFPVSFKEKVAFCSLQLSFAKKAVSSQLAADIDIDLLTDIGHFGEVIKNKVTRMKTDPFTVYVLLFDQGIRPLYTIKT